MNAVPGGAVPEAAVEAGTPIPVAGWRHLRMIHREGHPIAGTFYLQRGTRQLEAKCECCGEAIVAYYAPQHMGVDTAGDIKAIAVRAIEEAQTIGNRAGVETGSLSWWWGEALDQRRRAIAAALARDAALARADAAEERAEQLAVDLEHAHEAIESWKALVPREAHQMTCTCHGGPHGGYTCPGCRPRNAIARAQADTTCSTCGGSGRVDWAPGQQRDTEEDQQRCPDCAQADTTEGQS